MENFLALNHLRDALFSILLCHFVLFCCKVACVLDVLSPIKCWLSDQNDALNIYDEQNHHNKKIRDKHCWQTKNIENGKDMFSNSKFTTQNSLFINFYKMNEDE